jgi:hypothetical protein
MFVKLFINNQLIGKYLRPILHRLTGGHQVSLTELESTRERRNLHTEISPPIHPKMNRPLSLT